MILRPVRPVSPMGPPITKRPVGLMWYLVCSSSHSAGSTAWITCLRMSACSSSLLTLSAVLARDDHRVDARGLAVLVVLHRHLALAVGAQVGQLAVLAHLGQLAA